MEDKSRVKIKPDGTPSTAHWVVGPDDVELLADGTGVIKATVVAAFLGEPMRQAIALCKWARNKKQEEGEDWDPNFHLLEWAHDNKVGAFRVLRNEEVA